MGKDKDEKPDIFGMYQRLIDLENLHQSTSLSRGEPGYDELVSVDELEKEEDPENKIKSIPKPNQIEEELVFKRFRTTYQHKYTEKEMAEIRDSCQRTIVHDFAEHDVYHMSDEERARIDSLNELRMKLNGLRSVYRQIDKYIEAMRVVVEAWSLLEKKDNFIHSEKEFYHLVATGRIYNSSIPLPKMQHLDKYNMDMVIKYISNPELDPKDLVPAKNHDPWYDQFNDTDESAEEEMARLLSPEEVQYVLDHADTPETIKVHDIKPKYIKGYDRRATMFSKKKRKFNKKTQYYVDNLHSLLNKIQSNPYNRSDVGSNRSYLITSSMFEPEEKKDEWDDIRFDGSWADDDELFVYDLVMEEERLKQHPPGNAFQTYGDLEVQKFFRVMEDYGLNTIELRRKMNMTDDVLLKDTRKKDIKRNKKIEQELITRISSLNDNPKFKKLIKKAEKNISNYTAADED